MLEKEIEMVTPEEARESAKNLNDDFRSASIYWPNVSIATERLRDLASQVEALQSALQKIKAHPNCKHEVEAQLGEEIWEALT